MKRLFTLAAMVCCTVVMAKAEMVGDTIVIEQVNKVKIETRDTVQRIVINGSKDDPNFQYMQRISIPDTSAVRRSFKSVKDFNKITIKDRDGKPSKWQSSFHLNVGLNAVLGAPDEYEFRLWPSVEIGLKWLMDWHPYGKQNVWSAGLGFNYRELASKDDQYWVKVNDVMGLAPYTNEAERNTSLKVTTLEVPVMYTHYFDKKQKWGLTLGAVLGWNYYARANRTFELGDEEFDINLKKIGHRPITVEPLAIVRIPSFPDIYCKYSPMKFFKDNRGPKMNTLSFGFYW